MPLICIKVCIIGGVATLTDRRMVTQAAAAASCLLASLQLVGVPELDHWSVSALVEHSNYSNDITRPTGCCGVTVLTDHPGSLSSRFGEILGFYSVIHSLANIS